MLGAHSLSEADRLEATAILLPTSATPAASTGAAGSTRVPPAREARGTALSGADMIWQIDPALRRLRPTLEVMQDRALRPVITMAGVR